MTKTINRPKSATALAVILAAALGGGCLHAKPVAASRPIGAGSAMYPTLGLRFTAQEDPPAPIAPARGGYWSRNWGWWVGGAAAAVAADAATGGSILGLFDDGGDDPGRARYSDFTEKGPVAAASRGSTVTLTDVGSCNGFNFLAEEESEISCTEAQATPPGEF